VTCSGVWGKWSVRLVIRATSSQGTGKTGENKVVVDVKTVSDDHLVGEDVVVM
jgi:hypothetical protein